MQSFENTEQIWELMLSSLRKEKMESVMDLWLSKLRLVSVDEDSAILIAPTEMARKTVVKNFSGDLARHFEIILGYPVEITVLPPPDEQSANPPAVDMEISESVSAPEPSRDISVKNGGISMEYTFANFIVGKSNDFAYATCVAVAKVVAGDDPNVSVRDQNPLFLHGPSGIGKTHLMYAITNEILSKKPNTNIIYVKSEDFTNELIAAIAAKNTAGFKEKYRKSDILLIDDIQFIAGKESTQEEFFHTFNALYEDKTQIVLSSDRPPNEMKTLEDRIRTRFESGVMADINLPDFELRLAILKKKSESLNISIPNDVLNFLAEKLHSDIRKIEGVIKTLGSMSVHIGSPINMDLVKRTLPEFIRENEPPEAIVGRIAAAVAKKYGVTAADIMSGRRDKEIASARHATIYITRSVTGMSFPAIGKMFGRDHTTVMNSLKAIEKIFTSSPQVKSDVDDIIREIKN